MSMWSLPPLAIDLLAQLRLSIGVYDPGFIRSRTALRGLIAIMSACFATWLTARLFAPHLAIFMTLAGGLASYSASLRVQDPSRKARLVTYLLMIPACFLGGSAFCLGCDLIARTAFAPTEMSISSVTAVFGAPVVIYMMLRRKGAEA